MTFGPLGFAWIAWDPDWRCRSRHAWSFGFAIAPWPREEQSRGSFVRCLAGFEGRLALFPFRFQVQGWTDDAARRPIGRRNA